MPYYNLGNPVIKLKNKTLKKLKPIKWNMLLRPIYISPNIVLI